MASRETKTFEVRPVVCQVVCLFDEVRLYFGEQYMTLSIDQARELSEHLRNAAELAASYQGATDDRD